MMFKRCICTGGNRRNVPITIGMYGSEKAWKQGTTFYGLSVSVRHSSLVGTGHMMTKHIVLKRNSGLPRYANHLGGYWFNLEMGSSLPTLWLDHVQEDPNLPICAPSTRCI